MLTNLIFNAARPEDRAATTDAGPVYTYGKGDNWFTATLLVTTPELSSLNTLSQTDSNGALTSTLWKIVARDVSGSTKTLAATGVLRDYQIRKAEEGKVAIDMFVRITGDTITIS